MPSRQAAGCRRYVRASRPKYRFQISGLFSLRPRDLPWGTHFVKPADAYGRTTLLAIFLGIDGGGSKTSCLIGDETSILGSGSGAGSNVVRVGESQAREALSTAVRQACAVAQLAPSQIQRVCVGLAGAARPEVRDRVLAIISELIPGEIEVVGDIVITLQAAFGRGPGVIVIAGMDAALASVVGGIVPAPVIAVPTSTGYGASFGGLAALLTILNACAGGVSVVNIDNGFGAASTVIRMLGARPSGRTVVPALADPDVVSEVDELDDVSRG